MRRVVLGVLCVAVTGCSVFKRPVDKKSVQFHDTNSMAEMLRMLSSDEFEGRKPGSVGIEKASVYVESYFKEIGIKPLFDGTYRDTVFVRGKESYNLVGLINSDSPLNDYVLIGAHLDHLGKKKSRSDSVFNGANDNASGVTAVLQIAKELKRHDFEKKVIISIFTGEESGLIGAKHLAEKLKSEGIALSYVLNFEMLGKPLRSDSSKVYITGFDMSNFSSVANDLLGEEFIKFEQVTRDYGLFRLADNYPFYLEYKIPSHTVSTFDFKNYNYYHHVKDEFSQLDIEHMERIIAKSSEMIVKLLESNAEIKINH